eukprot:7846757-Lingulodinium_polyedra.AAC.1
MHGRVRGACNNGGRGIGSADAKRKRPPPTPAAGEAAVPGRRRLEEREVRGVLGRRRAVQEEVQVPGPGPPGSALAAISNASSFQ